MSLSFKAPILPDAYDSKSVQQAFQDLIRSLNAGYLHLTFQELHAEPEKITPHMMALADGADWDPKEVGDAQVVIRNAANTGWLGVVLNFDPYLAGTIYRQQTAPTTYAASGTLAAADVVSGMIRSTAGTPTYTLPTGAALAAAASVKLSANRAFDFSIIHAGAGTATVALSADFTNVGSLTIATGTSGLFRIRCTATNTYIIYRIA